ncbi:hypothetical protein Tco_0115634 [Tanacetum coccineum]
MTHLLEKETPFVFSKDCIDAFKTLKKKLTEAPISVVPDWNLPFENMVMSDFAIDDDRSSNSLHYDGEEMLAVVYAFEKFWPYLVLSKSIVYTDHLAFKILINIQVMSRRGVAPVGFFYYKIRFTIVDKKEVRNLAATLPDHLSRLENPHKDGIDCIGPVSVFTGNIYIPVAVDYRSKWVEAKAFPTNVALSLMSKYGVTHRLDTAYHPLNEQSSGGVQSWLETTIELSQPDGPNFKVNGHRVKHYFGGDLPPKESGEKREMQGGGPETEEA